MRGRLLLVLVWILAGTLIPETPALARPEFARREEKQCGFCHVNPRGGGPRNQVGIAYARNDFRFPETTGDLRDFKGKDRDAMTRVRMMLAVQHIPAALKQLRRLEKTVRDEAAKRAVKAEIHGLDVKGTEILGRARLLLRKPDKTDEALQLLLLLDQDYKGLSVQEDAAADLKDLRADKSKRPMIKAEKTQQKARRLLLDARLLKREGQSRKARELLHRIVEKHPDTRAAEDAENILNPPDPKDAE